MSPVTHRHRREQAPPPPPPEPVRRVRLIDAVVLGVLPLGVAPRVPPR